MLLEAETKDFPRAGPSDLQRVVPQRQGLQWMGGVLGESTGTPWPGLLDISSDVLVHWL